VALKDAALEVVLPEAATLTSLPAALLMPGALPELWQGEELAVKDLYGYFSGRVVMVPREGYEEPVTIPTAERAALDAALQAAVRDRRLWLIAGQGSFFAEELPVGVLAEDAYLLLPPRSIAAREILPVELPEAWSGEVTTALDIANALSTKAGKALPWFTVREAIDGAFRSRLLERTIDSGLWPCDYAGARAVRICVPREQPAQHTPITPPPSGLRESTIISAPGTLVAEAPLRVEEIQDLYDQLGDLVKATVGLNLQFHLRIELGPTSRVSNETTDKVNELLSEVSEKLRLQG
jgi:hypothetical protein